MWRQWGNDVAFVPEGGESLAAVGLESAKPAPNSGRRRPSRDVVVVTHVSPIKAGVAWVLGASDDVTWRMFVDVASVSTIGPGRGRAPGLPAGRVLRTFNETHHRPSE